MKVGAVLFILLIAQMDVFGQREFDDKTKDDWRNRIYFGGGVGFNSSTSGGYKFVYVGLYPSVGYMITNNLSGGVSLTYQYYSFPRIKQSYSQYGIGPFMRYNFTRIFFAYSEFALLNTPTFSFTNDRATYKRLLLGVGYSLAIGQRSAINVFGLYDVLYNTTDRVFGSPWVFRVNFSY